MKENCSIPAGNTYLGIELGSTRIKAVLIDGETYLPLASGAYDWENKLSDGLWTYSLDSVEAGVRGCYAALKSDVLEKYGAVLKKVGCIGISAMMHGYLAFDKNGSLLVPFRTWRNTVTAEASDELTQLFNFNIPQRWSIAHLYQSILNKEEHVGKIVNITTLSGYVHRLLTGKNVLGVGDASGMMPVDAEGGCYDGVMLEKLNRKLSEKGICYKAEEILPEILHAGENAGFLTEYGASWLDPSGDLSAGIPFCPPEGDAETGMAATDSIDVRTGNVSAGTSIFAMVVLESPLSELHREIDIVATPDGKPVAMVHCNNCTSDINAWADLFSGFAKSIGVEMSKGKMLDKMFELANNGSPDCGGLCACNYLSGEHITGFSEGRPMFLRCPDSEFSVENFFRTQLYSAVATLKLGMDILVEGEHVKIDRLLGHGGYFKAADVGQSILAAALDTDISVMKTAAEGGAYGMALLAAYACNNGTSLTEFLNTHVFADCEVKTKSPERASVEGFDKFIERYKLILSAEKAAVM